MKTTVTSAPETRNVLPGFRFRPGPVARRGSAGTTPTVAPSCPAAPAASYAGNIGIQVLYYRFPAARRGVLILLSLLAGALATAAEDCCKPGKPAPKKDSCCAAMEAAPFSRESIYQADASFVTDAGRTFHLGELRGRPVLLTMFFASCGYACPLLVSDLESIRAKLPADLRERAAIVLVSFDTERDTPAALAAYRTQRGLDAQWTLLHGGKDAVSELAALLGVKYQRAADGMFSHSNLITVLNAEGEIVHQRAGLKGGLDEAAAMLAKVAK